VRLVECLLDRRWDPAPIVDAVALLAGPLPYGLGLLTGPTTPTVPGAGLVATAARAAGWAGAGG